MYQKFSEASSLVCDYYVHSMVVVTADSDCCIPCDCLLKTESEGVLFLLSLAFVDSVLAQRGLLDLTAHGKPHPALFCVVDQWKFQL